MQSFSLSGPEIKADNTILCRRCIGDATKRKITLVNESSQIWAGVSYICNVIGLKKNEKDRQVKNVQDDRVMKEGGVKFDAGVFDPNNQAVAIKLDFVLLLQTINRQKKAPNK